MNIILIAKSGSGKNFARDYLINKYGLNPIISHTTRPIRQGELEAQDYYFIDKDIFTDLKLKNSFLEERSYAVIYEGYNDVWKYATSFLEFENKRDNWICIKDLQGAKEIKEYFPNTKIIYIHCDDDIREIRARQRGSFCPLEWGRRLMKDNEDFSINKLLGNVDYYLDNSHLSLEDFKLELDKVLVQILEEN
jgi:guanylate kinase